jgi:hypothetical protein
MWPGEFAGVVKVTSMEGFESSGTMFQILFRTAPSIQLFTELHNESVNFARVGMEERSFITYCTAQRQPQF